MEFVFRVKFQNLKKFVTLTEGELEWQTFVDKGNFENCNFHKIVKVNLFSVTFYFIALALFGTKITQQSVVYLFDNTGTEIPQQLFPFIVKHFWNGSNFHIEIKYTPTRKQNNDLVTPDVRHF